MGKAPSLRRRLEIHHPGRARREDPNCDLAHAECGAEGFAKQLSGWKRRETMKLSRGFLEGLRPAC